MIVKKYDVTLYVLFNTTSYKSFDLHYSLHFHLTPIISVSNCACLFSHLSFSLHRRQEQLKHLTYPHSQPFSPVTWQKWKFLKRLFGILVLAIATGVPPTLASQASLLSCHRFHRNKLSPIKICWSIERTKNIFHKCFQKRQELVSSLLHLP